MNLAQSGSVQRLAAAELTTKTSSQSELKSMKKYLLLSSRAALGLAVFLAAGSLRAADMVKYESKPGSEVKIDGTSNIHDWTVKGQIISGFIEVSPEFDKDLKSVSPAPKVEVAIPVRSLKSGNKKMDEVMQEHMNMKANPKIEYKLTGLKLKTEPKTPNGPAEFVSTGDLTIMGTKKPIEMPVTFERVEGGKLRIKGSIPIKMTDFGIKPPAPALAMGLIKTGDDVTVAIDWVVEKATESAAAK
jgi:polyisoprenoid-binding protein YceI